VGDNQEALSRIKWSFSMNNPLVFLGTMQQVSIAEKIHFTPTSCVSDHIQE
jgi:hypothetical protein